MNRRPPHIPILLRAILVRHTGDVKQFRFSLPERWARGGICAPLEEEGDGEASETLDKGQNSLRWRCKSGLA